METMQKEDIIRQILLMPPIDRIEIIDKIYEGFDNDNSADYEALWAEEAERRIDGFLNGEIPVYSLEEVFRQINEMK